MKQKRMTHIVLILAGIMMTLVSAGCSGGSGGGASRVQIPALMSPDSVQGPAAAKNNEGVDHLVQGHYDVALKHFKAALAAKPDFAEAHFNLAVSLDGLGKHGEATSAFEKAKQFGGSKQTIAENSLLKKHLNL